MVAASLVKDISEIFLFNHQIGPVCFFSSIEDYAFNPQAQP